MVNIIKQGSYINPDRPGKHHQTPILLAGKDGDERVVKLLLGRKDVRPYMLDDDGLTPLPWPARNGHGGVVKLLLGRES